jgi:hypothetical protein
MRKRQEDQDVTCDGSLRFPEAWRESLGPATCVSFSGCGRGVIAAFRLNSLKKGYFKKHYMLHDLFLMRSICCDKLPTIVGPGTSIAFVSALLERMFSKAGQAGQGEAKVFPTGGRGEHAARKTRSIQTKRQP